MLKEDDSVWATGVNNFGQLGIDSDSYIMLLSFVEVFAPDAMAVAAGGGHSMVAGIAWHRAGQTLCRRQQVALRASIGRCQARTLAI